MSRYLRYILIAAMSLMAAWLLFCTHIAGVFPVKEILGRIAVPVIVYMVSAVLFAGLGPKGRTLLSVCLCVFTLFESVVGILQMSKLIPTINSEFILTGHFKNQGLYGGLMALTCVLCLYEFIRAGHRKYRFAVAFVFVVSFVMMAISLSRAGWLGFVVVAAVILYREKHLRIDFSRKVNLVTAITLAVAVCILVFLIKPGSAISRLHIWRMDCKAVLEHPLTGVGSAAEIGAYGEAQEHFFRQKHRTSRVIQVADSPKYVCNEFLKFSMQGGFPSLILSIAVYGLALLILYRKRSEYFYILLALGVFALFSYPLSSITFCSILAVILADASVSESDKVVCWAVVAVVVTVALAPVAPRVFKEINARKEWQKEPYSSRHFGKYYPELKFELDYIFAYGLTLYNHGYYDRALEILSNAAGFNSNAGHYCLIGICLEATGDYKAALEAFRKATYMVPTRMTPYYEMIRCCLSMGFYTEARECRERALAVPYKTSQSETVKVRKMIEDIRL